MTTVVKDSIGTYAVVNNKSSIREDIQQSELIEEKELDVVLATVDCNLLPRGGQASSKFLLLVKLEPDDSQPVSTMFSCIKLSNGW
jgi:hypothetical protein